MEGREKKKERLEKEGEVERKLKGGRGENGKGEQRERKTGDGRETGMGEKSRAKGREQKMSVR